jgi:hypothetical protein
MLRQLKRATTEEGRSVQRAASVQSTKVATSAVGLNRSLGAYVHSAAIIVPCGYLLTPWKDNKPAARPF